MGKTDMIFVDQGVKINSQCNTILHENFLPQMTEVCEENFILQQDGAPSHTS
jgi:hypothetical protein